VKVNAVRIAEIKFKNSDRALSHGCVRVENWQGLAFFMARQESLGMEDGQAVAYSEESV
jgi:murein L,D-transpeptidase YcbB/YkuD